MSGSLALPVIRVAGPGDADALTLVEQAANIVGLVHIFPQDRFPFPADEVRTRWARELADPAMTIHLAAGADGTPLGYVASRDDCLVHIATVPAAWGGGLADRMHDQALADIAARGFTRAWLWVLEENARARSYYRKRGWHATGVVERTPFPPHPVKRRMERTLG